MHLTAACKFFGDFFFSLQKFAKSNLVHFFPVFAPLSTLRSTLLCSGEVGQGIRGQCYGVFQVTENTAAIRSKEKRMRASTNLKKACPSIWCSRPRLATAWA